jgi:hypothetical protein
MLSQTYWLAMDEYHRRQVLLQFVDGEGGSLVILGSRHFQEIYNILVELCDDGVGSTVHLIDGHETHIFPADPDHIKSIYVRDLDSETILLMSGLQPLLAIFG